MNDDNVIIEVMPDGTIHHFDMDICSAEAEAALETLWQKENTQLGFDYTATVFSLFVNAVTILTQNGWSTTELLQEVLNNSEADDITLCDDDGDDFEEDDDCDD